MSATTETEGPTFETRPQGRCIVYEVVLYRDGEEVDRREVSELLHVLPEDPDEAASLMEDRIARWGERMERRFAERGEKEEALRQRLGS